MCWRNGQNIGIKSTVSISKDKKCYQNQYYVWSLLTLTPYCTRCLIDKMMRQITAYGMLIHSSCKAGGGICQCSIPTRWATFDSSMSFWRTILLKKFHIDPEAVLLQPNSTPCSYIELSFLWLTSGISIYNI